MSVFAFSSFNFFKAIIFTSKLAQSGCSERSINSEQSSILKSRYLAFFKNRYLGNSFSVKDLSSVNGSRRGAIRSRSQKNLIVLVLRPVCFKASPINIYAHFPLNAWVNVLTAYLEYSFQSQEGQLFTS